MRQPALVPFDTVSPAERPRATGGRWRTERETGYCWRRPYSPQPAPPDLGPADLVRYLPDVPPGIGHPLRAGFRGRLVDRPGPERHQRYHGQRRERGPESA